MDALRKARAVVVLTGAGVSAESGIPTFRDAMDGLWSKFDPHELAAILEASYGILTRAGIHCAPLVHRAIGTLQTGGTTRFSFGPFLTTQDVTFATDALPEIATSRVAVK